MFNLKVCEEVDRTLDIIKTNHEKGISEAITLFGLHVDEAVKHKELKAKVRDLVLLVKKYKSISAIPESAFHEYVGVLDKLSDEWL